MDEGLKKVLATDSNEACKPSIPDKGVFVQRQFEETRRMYWIYKIYRGNRSRSIKFGPKTIRADRNRRFADNCNKKQ